MATLLRVFGLKSQSESRPGGLPTVYFSPLICDFLFISCSFFLSKTSLSSSQTSHNKPDQSHQHFVAALLISCLLLSSDSLFVLEPMILSPEENTDRNTGSSTGVLNLINNCQEEGKQRERRPL